MSKILLTGAAGFVGAHFVEHILKNTDWNIVALDRLDISGNLERLRDIDVWDENRVKFVWWDLKAPLNEGVKKDIGKIDYIFHLAASSHVDRSITDPLSFVMDNTVGTQNLIDYARGIDLKCFFYFSTDEVFGPAPEGVFFKEEDPHNPSNPYAASKSGAEMLVKAAMNTYKLPAIITRSMNIFGERQHPEKYIPLVIKKVLSGEKLLIHANKDKTKAGSRCWIHARTVADGYMFLVENGKIGETYNIVGEEMDNLELAQIIADVIGKPLNYELVDFHSERPGHDLRYAMSGEKLANMGWTPTKDLKQSLTKTIKWMVENKRWL